MKGAEFLIKAQSPEDVFIPAELNEEQKMIMEMASEFIEKEVMPNLDEIESLKEGLTPSLLEKAGELGLLGTSIPEEYGGFGKDFNTNTALSIAIGPSHSFGVSLAAHTGIGTLPILYFGTDEQKNEYLPGLASGELKAAYCLTEPSSGSDALGAKSTAVLSDDKSHYVLNGQKMWITNGGFADIFIVFAKIKGANHLGTDAEGFTGFIVKADSEGVTRGAEEKKMGIKGSSTRQIFFENVKVPAGNVLGEIGKGHKIAFNILNIGRFKLCAMVVGGARKSAQIGLAYAKERKQFGTAIANFGAIREKIAKQAAYIWAVEAATYRVSDLIDKDIERLKAEGKTYVEALMQSAEEFAAECAMLKVSGSEMLDYVVDETVQIHGGYGFSEEFPAARTYRDARINRIFEGTNEINRLLTIDQVMRKAMKGTLPLFQAATQVQKELMEIPDFGDADISTVEWYGNKIQEAKKAILLTAGAAAQKFGLELQHQQEVMMAISDMAIDLYIAESAMLRYQKKAMSGAARPEEIIAITTAHDALEKMYVNGKNALAASLSGDDLRMASLGVKRFTKVQNIDIIGLRKELGELIIDKGEFKI